MSTTTDAIRAIAARLGVRKGTGRSAKGARTAAVTLLVAGVTLALTTTGGTTALWTGSVTVQPPSIASASITAYVSDLSTISTTFTSSALTKTSSFVVDNTGTTLASASLRLSVGAGSSPALAATTTLTMWDVSDPSSCTETATPINGWSGPWNAFPLLTGTLTPHEHETFCVRSRTAASNLTASASISPTAVLDLSVPGTRWTSSATTSATLSVAPDAAVVGNDYTAAVRADGANRYWRLGESSGSVLYDLVGIDDAYAGSGLTRGVAGSNSSDANTATTFSGDANGSAGTRRAIWSPQSFAVEAWFKTTSTTGGKIVGFGSSSTGLSASADRHIYLDAAGHVNWGVWTNAANTITTPSVYNDGQWHHVVGSLGASGQQLYLDGDLIGSLAITSAYSYGGFWRIGGDSAWGGDAYFDGTIDEVAIYNGPLSTASVKRHYGISSGIPAASFTSTVTDYTATTDASASIDFNGALASYSWNWGDGTAADTGVSATHTYALSGTYTVTLTVTDNAGNTDSVTGTVIAADTTAPTAPTNVAVTDNSATGVSLNWTAATDSVGVVRYQVYRDGVATADSTTATTYADPAQHLTAGTTYTYTVKAFDAAGNASPASAPLSVTRTWTVDNAAWYQVSPQSASTMCVNAPALDDYTMLTQDTCATSATQNWQFVPTTGGYVKASLRAQPVSVWNVDGTNMQPGANVILYHSIGAANEEWQITVISPNVVTFTARHSGLCLTVPGSSAVAGTKLTQDVCTAGAANQQFTLVVAP